MDIPSRALERRKLVNVLLLGLAFMLIFTGYITMAGIQTIIFASASTPGSGGYVPGFKGNGFTASAVGYTMFALASLLAPTIVGWKGSRLLVHSIYRPAASSQHLPSIRLLRSDWDGGTDSVERSGELPGHVQ